MPTDDTVEHDSTDGVTPSPAASYGVDAHPEPPPVKWCAHCGEGVTTFCRGKTEACPMKFKKPGAPGASGVALPRAAKATDDEVRAWADRHGLRISSMTDLRCAFEDAQTACGVAIPLAGQPSEAPDA